MSMPKKVSKKLEHLLGRTPAKPQASASEAPNRSVGVTPEDVTWCYQQLLGREPESDAMVRAHLITPDFKQLVLGFVGCPEFLSRNPSINLSATEERRLPPYMGKLDIDTNATPRELDQCAAKIKKAWEHLGEEKAHFSVLTYEAFRPENLSQSIDSFWASGEPEAMVAKQVHDQYGAGNLADKVCVEYGCGVGRVTVNFAKHFKTVHGYDISRNHLRHARARAAEVGVHNIEFHECSQDFRVAIKPCDFFYSIIVLQHNPPPVIVELLRIALSALKPGGIAIFQLPTYIIGYRFNLQEWLAADHALDMQMHCVPQDLVLEIMTQSGCRLLGVREDGWSGATDRMISNTFICKKNNA